MLVEEMLLVAGLPMDEVSVAGVAGCTSVVPILGGSLSE